MFRKIAFSISFGRRIRWRSAASWIGIFLACMLSAGFLFATPIASSSGDGEGNLRQTANLRAVHATRNPTELMMIESTAPSHPGSWTLTKGTAEGCPFTAHCSSAVEVPEPQSLLLVGTGLLSMAGVIRRRLLR